MNNFKMKAKLWLYPGKAGWHFLTLPAAESEAMEQMFGSIARGFGSLPVCVTIGDSDWETSIFPSKKSGGYILPVKAAVRKKEKLIDGDIVNFSLSVKV